jgi:predicted metal-dependent hydrolase
MSRALTAKPSAEPGGPQLDLFEPRAAKAPATVAAPSAGPHMPAREHQAPSGATHPHRLFQHPRSNRALLLGEHRIGYELRRARRRSIGFVVSEEGLVVSAPRWVGVGDIEAALLVKSRWILRKLVDQGERLNQVAAARVDWRHGAELPYLGAPLRIVLDPQAQGVHLVASNTSSDTSGNTASDTRRELHIGLPHTAEIPQIRDAVQSWLQRQALQLFAERCAHFAIALGVHVRQIKLSSARTRWGSATTGGIIRLHWRLLHFAPATIDYVVAHELAHLREMNHSAAFWEVVGSVLPHYEDARRALKHQTLPVFD